MPEPGEVILACVQFTDTFEIKKRPAVVLFEEHGNVIVAGVTSNTAMEGIPLTRKEGAVRDSVIKPNYLFTVSGDLILKVLFPLSAARKRQLHDALEARLEHLVKR